MSEQWPDELKDSENRWDEPSPFNQFDFWFSLIVFAVLGFLMFAD
jgi:hypothetical protein